MLKEIQFQKGKQQLYLLDEAYQVTGSYECRSDFWPGCNEAGQKRASLPVGIYPEITAEVTEGKYGPAYGNFYITTGDPRGRDIHGGGSNCEDPFADRQGWHKTLGCLRMQNEDGVELSREIIRSCRAGVEVVLTVVA